MLIGESNSGYKVSWNILKRHNYNNFVLLTGKSGSGKTTQARHLVGGAADDGIASLIIDNSGSYYRSDIEKIYTSINYINIEIDGLGIKPFKPRVKYVEGITYSESSEDTAYRITDILCTGFKIRGAKQRSGLREAIFSALQINGENTSFKDVYNIIEDQDLASRVFSLTRDNMSKGHIDWYQLLKPGTVTVIQLSDTDEYNKIICTELLLADLWNTTQQKALGEYLLCLDEVQNLSFKHDATITRFLRESRKYSVSMLLSTQFISKNNSDMRELLEQTGLRMYFKPSDSDIIAVAKSIDNSNYREWLHVLQNLKIGEFVFVGNGIVGGEPRDLKVKLTRKI